MHDEGGRQRALLQGMPDAVIVVDDRGRIREVNRQTEVLFGYPADELVGTSIERLVPAEHRGHHASLRSGYVAAQHAMPVGTGAGLHGLRKDGSQVPVEISLASVPMPDDAPAVIATVRDVSSTRDLERRLRDSERLFRRAFDDAPTGMLLLSLRDPTRGHVVLVNRTYCSLLERSEADLLGRPGTDAVHPAEQPDVARSLEMLAGSTTSDLRTERRLVTASGRVRLVEATTSVVADPDGRPEYAVVQIEDVTTRRQAERELAHRALHDDLTALPNRHHMLSRIRQALSRTSRREGSQMAVLFMDLDNFKEINDALGHGAGDELLVDVARRLQDCLRAGDSAGRLGGDEFVVLCEDLADADDAAVVAERIERALDIDIPVRDHTIRLTASIGIAVSSGHDSVEDLLQEADSAMYQAKWGGRARHAHADAGAREHALRKVRVAADLRRTLGAGRVRETAGAAAEPWGRFLLHYQAVARPGPQQVVAVEALVRWDHPERGLLSPAEFIDVAEERGLIAPLGGWVVDEAVAQLARWRDVLGRRAPEMWVNVSAGQLGDGSLSERVTAALDRHGVPARAFGIEVTERQVVSTAQGSHLAELEALVAKGCRLAIDDFGTGHNDMSHLRDLPVDTLKIDASYTRGLGADRINTRSRRASSPWRTAWVCRWSPRAWRRPTSSTT
jgi:diguanylate cyclase (GGDEF)-like protein/PAS domain S-box-containing protein